MSETSTAANYRYREFWIPEYMSDGLDLWITRHIMPGQFLQAVLSNDLRGAVERADDQNIRNLPAYIAYLYNHAPSPCWGSPEKVKAWAEAKP